MGWRGWAKGAVLLGLAGCGQRCGAPPAPPPPTGPSVLVVLWDTVRADRMSLYGHDRPTTPALERFAADAAVYERAQSPGMWTVPSHGSLFTGLPAASHGAKVGWLWLDDAHVTLAEHFRDHGWATYAWSTNPYLSDQTHLLQGFDTVSYSWRGPTAARCAEATRSKLLPQDASMELGPAFVAPSHAQGWPEHLVAYKDAGPVIAEDFLAWVDQRPGQPFFAYLNYLEAHHPRIPSAASRAAVADPALVERSLSTDGSLFRLMAAMEGRATFTAAELEALAATYDATLRDLDAATATLLEGLAARGRLDDTIVVITSDHGENLGERGMFDHRWDLHATLTHVPLVIRYPAKVPAGRVEAPVSTQHLFGTLLALTGLPAPAVDHPLPPLGAEPAVFSELVAPTPRLPEIRAAFPDLDRDRWRRRFQAVVEDRLELIRDSAGGVELYDRVADPGQTRSLAADRPDDLARLQARLEAWTRSRPAYDPGRRLPSDRPGNPLRPDPEAMEQLKALGYAVEDGPGDGGSEEGE